MNPVNENKEENLKQIKSKINIDNLKSDFFLIKLFKIINVKKLLAIIKYNKKLQKRVNININKIKKYSELFSSIEIELKLAYNDKFINIYEKDKKYYHIYNLEENGEVKKIKIIIDYQIKSFRRLFYSCKCIESIVFKKFARTNIFDMSKMFSKCTSLKVLNISKINTNNTTDMSCMFKGCSSLKELDLSNFNTNNVANMSWMFAGCGALKTLNVSSFNTSKVNEMYRMFKGCSSLKELDLSNFNIKNDINMVSMFEGCLSLKKLYLSDSLYNTGFDYKAFFKCPEYLEFIVKNNDIKDI